MIARIPAAFFRLDALVFALMRLQQLGDTGPLAQAAPLAFGLVNAVVAWLTPGTLWRPVRGQRLSQPEIGPRRRRRLQITRNQKEETR
jgi:hypothetical protein